MAIPDFLREPEPERELTILPVGKPEEDPIEAALNAMHLQELAETLGGPALDASVEISLRFLAQKLSKKRIHSNRRRQGSLQPLSLKKHQRCLNQNQEKL